MHAAAVVMYFAAVVMHGATAVMYVETVVTQAATAVMHGAARVVCDCTGEMAAGRVVMQPPVVLPALPAEPMQ